MEPFTAGILVTCGLIAINVMVAVFVEKSHHRTLAGVEYKSNGSFILATSKAKSDDPTRRLLGPQDSIKNYTSLQISSDSHFQTIMKDKGLLYNISTYKNSPNINMSSSTSDNKEVTTECTNTSQNSNQSDTTPQDTTNDDALNFTQNNTIPHEIADPSNPTQSNTIPQDTLQSDVTDPKPTQSDRLPQTRCHTQ